MSELTDLLGEVLNDEYYKQKIKETVFKKTISVIEYSSNEIIQEIMKGVFTPELKLEIAKAIEIQKENFKIRILESVKNSMNDFAKKVTFEPYSYSFEKLLKESIKIKDK